jgi:hypothetical protein
MHVAMRVGRVVGNLHQDKAAANHRENQDDGDNSGGSGFQRFHGAAARECPYLCALMYFGSGGANVTGITLYNFFCKPPL